MKKHLLIPYLLCGSVYAIPYYLPTPPAGGLTPFDCQPTARIEGLYAIGASDTPDTAGFRLSLNLYNNAESSIRHEFNLGMSPQWGNGHRFRHEHRASQNLFMIPLTGGYTLNINLFNNISLCIGGKAGWAFGHYKEKSVLHRDSGTCNGFTFSAGAGLHFRCSERVYVQTGYDFARTYTNTRHDDIWSQHIISAGIGWLF